MKVTFLGTAAAEGIPALWCECEVCRKAQQQRGRDLRRRCAYLIDSDTLVDFGPDIFWQCTEFNIDLTRIDRIVFTHAHSDHLNGIEFIWRRTPWFSTLRHRIKVFGSPAIFARMLSQITMDSSIYQLSDLLIDPVEVRHGQTTDDGDFELLTLNADHAPGLEPQVHVIGRNGKRFFIANDTGFLREESWELLKGVKLDLVEIDCTCGLRTPDCDRGHQGVNSVLAFRDRLLDLGCITPETPVYANHFSHNGGALHADLEAFFAPHRIRVAYDGLTVEL